MSEEIKRLGLRETIPGSYLFDKHPECPTPQSVGGVGQDTVAGEGRGGRGQCGHKTQLTVVPHVTHRPQGQGTGLHRQHAHSH